MRALLVRQAGSHRKECSSSSSGAAIRGHVLVRQSRTALTARPAAMTAPAPASHDTSDDMPAWVSALEARPGITQPNGHRYWEAKEEGTQPHGTDTIVAWLHEGSAPALRNARVYLDKSAKRVYGVMALGARVCGHPGIVHGGVTALMFDEMFGQVRVRVCVCRACARGRAGAVQNKHGDLSTFLTAGLLGVARSYPRRWVHRQPEC